MGNGEWGMGKKQGSRGSRGQGDLSENLNKSFSFPMPNAQFSMPNSQFPIPNAQFSMPNSL
ncbi:MAG: hypothetical protein V7K98_25250 [Nostoc sp.]|uniref:hypothetical protein n=1 Tax=Nostoc sp. TaxID=1180 RepID=UPI002FF8A33F